VIGILFTELSVVSGQLSVAKKRKAHRAWREADYERFWSTGALQNIKFQAPNYKQISNSNIQ
jgi:hypothetical protein